MDDDDDQGIVLCCLCFVAVLCAVLCQIGKEHSCAVCCAAVLSLCYFGQLCAVLEGKRHEKCRRSE